MSHLPNFVKNFVVTNVIALVRVAGAVIMEQSYRKGC